MRSIRKRAAAVRLALPLLLVAGLAAAAGPTPQPQSTVLVTGDPVAPPFGIPGQGLCAASAVSTNASQDFSPDNPAAFPVTLNALMERTAASRTDATLRTVFDLSNNNLLTPQHLSFGDFTDAQLPTCRTGGCDFVYNDTSTSFGVRLRGYLNVTSVMVGRPLHFGFYADDAVALILYDKAAKPYVVVDRPPRLGTAAWRTTNTVRFTKAGLYPVEVLYAQVAGDAALEMSYLDGSTVGSFSDFEDSASATTSLKTSQFTLFTPDYFFQAENGDFSFSDPAKCVQCNRQNAGVSGNADCGAGLYCNNAALCAPCSSALYCGPSCAPCGLATPVCLNLGGTYSCVQCNKNSDCGAQVCDTGTHTCKECNADKDCPQGKVCDVDAHECKQCNADAQCGRGNTCSDHACLPCSTKDQLRRHLLQLLPRRHPVRRALPGRPAHLRRVRQRQPVRRRQAAATPSTAAAWTPSPSATPPDRCGPSCSSAPPSAPTASTARSAWSAATTCECGDGQFCLSGECASCTTDRHCGARCGACDKDKPFCLTDGTTAGSSCVALPQ